MKRFLSTTVLLAAVFTSAGYAQAQLVMEPSRVKLKVTPGETIIDSVTLHNGSDQDMELNVYWQDFEYIEPFNGKKNFLPAGTSPYSMGSWFTHSPQEIIIPAKEKRDINYTIKVPDDFSGGHYGVLFYEQGRPKQTEATGVSIVTRLGTLFYVDPVYMDKSSHIDEMKIEDNALHGSFRNAGDSYLFPKGVYFVMDDEGSVYDRGELNKIYLPPNQTADFKIESLNQLDTGEYTVVLTFDLDDGDSLVKEIDIRVSEGGRLTVLDIRD